MDIVDVNKEEAGGRRGSREGSQWILQIWRERRGKGRKWVVIDTPKKGLFRPEVGAPDV